MMVRFYQNCCSPTKKNTEEKDTKKKGGGTRCNFQSNVNRVLIVHRGEYPQVHGDGKACKMKGKHVHGGCVSRARGGRGR